MARLSDVWKKAQEPTKGRLEIVSQPLGIAPIGRSFGYC
jgi:hypothetical protein